MCAAYIGNIPATQATQTHQTFTATASQTTFNTAGYDVGFEVVYLNGVKLVRGTDYTATNGSDIVLTTGAASGDTLDFINYGTFEVNSQNFTGDFTVDTDVLVVDSTNDRVGVNKASPAFPLDVTGAIATDTGIYLGGTGASNLLDDYEEGTWTPTVDSGTCGVQHASYIKIGKMVHVTFKINNLSDTSTVSAINVSLPFTAGSFSASEWYGTWIIRRYDVSTSVSGAMRVLGNGTTMDFIYSDTTVGSEPATVKYSDNTSTTNEYLSGSVTYFTAS
jgi:hypothetical protein